MANISVITDNYSVKGDGTLGNELISTTAVPYYDYGSNFSLTGQGIYKAISGTVTFNTTNFIYGSRVIIFTTINNLLNITGSSTSIKYQGTSNDNIQQNASTICQYLYADNNTYIFRSFNQSNFQTFTPNVSSQINLLYTGFYKIQGEIDTQVVDFPNPLYFEGQKITIWNTATNPIDFSSTILTTSGFKPKDLNGVDINTIVSLMTNFQSINGIWSLVN